MPKVAVIVCSKQADDALCLRDSIQANCTPAFSWTEIVAAKSIGAGYNKAMGLSDSDVCLFTHSDVTVWAGRTLWDEMIALALRPEVGLVGIAGSTDLDDTAAWWQGKGVKRGAVAHINKGQTYISSFGPFGDVKVLDGLLLCASRKRLEELGPWPEDTGFHFYDIEMSLRAWAAGYKNKVVPFPVLHGSIGQVTQEWEKARGKFMERYKVFMETGAMPR